MKKFLAVLLVALVVLTGCSNKEDDNKTPGATYKIGQGIVTTHKGTEDTFQVDTYYATVVLDGDTIKYVYIDTAQNKLTVDGEGVATKFEGKGTKKELGDDYNMKKFANAVGEWYEQIASLETWMTGKTVAQVLAMETYEKDESHLAVPNVEDLKSSVTITVDKYLEVVKQAAENAVEVNNVAKVAVGSNTSAKTEGLEINSEIGTVAVDGEGKIVYAYIDAMQSKAEFKEGVVTPGAVINTKKQLGSEYGMTKNPTAVAEWDVQMTSFEKYMVGRTLSDVINMPTTGDEGAKVADVEDLKSTVTIKISGYLNLLNKLSENLVEVK